jgi:ABC-type phosphate/phosphonate transport system substrate-binding protein
MRHALASALRLLGCLLLVFGSLPAAIAAEPQPPAAPGKATFEPRPTTPPLLLEDTGRLILSAAPRETPEQGAQRFAPLARYLSEAIGREIEYRHPGDWGVYRTQMVRGAYDIVFDGPHLTGWRIEHLHYHVLVRFAGDFTFALIARRDNPRVTQAAQVAGRTLCAHAPPNFATSLALALFDNPLRQPKLEITEGWKNIYQGVAGGRCVAGIVPVAELAALDPNAGTVRVLYRSPPYPNQAFSAGPRLSEKERQRLAQALTAPQAEDALRAIRGAYGMQQALVAADNGQYRGLARFLDNEWGFDQTRP